MVNSFLSNMEIALDNGPAKALITNKNILSMVGEVGLEPTKR
jgi:hypothetical protein